MGKARRPDAGKGAAGWEETRPEQAPAVIVYVPAAEKRYRINLVHPAMLKAALNAAQK